MNTQKIEVLKRTGKRDFEKLLFNFCYYLISGILLFSGITKILGPTSFIETIKAIKFFPDEIVILISTILPIAEIGLGTMLLLNIKEQIAIKMSFALFLLFFLFSIYGTVIGLDNDCGCFGSAVETGFGILMIIRNFVILIINIILLKTIPSNS